MQPIVHEYLVHLEIVEKKGKKEKTIKSDIEKEEYIFQHENGMLRKEKQDDYPPGSKLLFKVRPSLSSKNKFEIIKPTNKSLKKNDEESMHHLKRYAWYRIKSKNENDKEDYILNENDIIKLGNQIYEVFKIKNKDNQDSKDKKKEKDNQESINTNNKSKDTNIESKTEESNKEFKVSNKEFIDTNKETEFSNSELKDANKESNQESKNTNNESKVSNKENKTEQSNKESKVADYDISNNYDISNINKKIDSIFEIFSLDNITKNTKNCRCCGKGEDNDNAKESEDPKKSNERNPLFTICSCGTSVHYECFMEEISIIINNKNINQIFTIEFNCPKCNEPYPLRFRKGTTIYDLIDYTLFQNSNYIILECVNEKNKNNNKKLVHFITLNKEEKITIGRNKNNHVIDNDQTVSGFHAVLKYKENGDLIIEDISSKSGTFVLIKGNIQMKKKTIKFQISHAGLINDITANLA